MGWRFRSDRGGAGFCPDCGEDCTLLRRPGPVERVRYFLVYGMPAPEVWRCPNGHETGGRTGITLTYTDRKPRMPRLLRRVAHMARVIHQARSAEPTPLTYLMAAGIGVALGGILDVVLGWRWWLVATGVVVAVWLVFLSSALRPADRAGLVQRLRYVLDPMDAHRRELTSFAARVDEGAIAAYGVVDWEGSIGLGGWTGAGTAISSLTLAHHAVGSSVGPAVEVVYHTAERYFPATPADQVREDFVVNSIEISPAAEPGDLGRRMTRRRWQALQEPLPDWQETTMEVDGAAVEFEMIRRGNRFVAVAPIGDGYLVVHGQGRAPGSIAIGRVADITPYVDATLARIAAGRP